MGAKLSWETPLAAPAEPRAVPTILNQILASPEYTAIAKQWEQATATLSAASTAMETAMRCGSRLLSAVQGIAHADDAAWAAYRGMRYALPKRQHQRDLEGARQPDKKKKKPTLRPSFSRPRELTHTLYTHTPSPPHVATKRVFPPPRTRNSGPNLLSESAGFMSEPTAS